MSGLLGLERNRVPLAVIGVEHPLGQAARVNVGDFPGQVVSFRDAQVHPLSADRAADVGGITDQEHAADPLGVCAPMLERRHGFRRRVGQLHQLTSAVAQLLEALHGQGHALAFRRQLTRDLHEQTVATLVVQWRHGDVAFALPQEKHALVVPAVPADVHVGQHEVPHVVLAIEAQAKLFADRAARAIGADQPRHLDRLPLSRGLLQCRHDVRALVAHVQQLCLPLDAPAQLAQTIHQQALGLGLGQAQQQRVRRIEQREVVAQDGFAA